MNWLPIESAPTVDPGDTSAEIPTVLVWGEGIGIHMGRAWRYPDGEIRATAHGFYGDWKFTHWMPLPEPPK